MERQSRRKAEFSQKSSKSRVLKKCTPSRREPHFGEERVPGERQSRRGSENYKPLQQHTCLKMRAPSRREGHLGRVGVSGPSWHRPPAYNPNSRLRSRKMGGSTFERLTRNLGILAAYPAAIAEAGERERPANNTPPQPLGGGRGRLILIKSLS